MTIFWMIILIQIGNLRKEENSILGFYIYEKFYPKCLLICTLKDEYKHTHVDSWNNWKRKLFESYFQFEDLTHFSAAAAAAKSLQSCPTLCYPIDVSPPGSAVPGILQARTLEWVAISFSNAWKWKVTGKSLSRVRLSATPWTAAYQAPSSMGFSRQEYWSGVPLPFPNSLFY